MLYDGWHGPVRVLVVGGLAYLALVALLRISGKRTLAKLNAFDLILTVALGSTLATVLLSSTVSVAEGVTALALLIGLQYAVTWSSVRSARLRRLVRSEPTLLVYQGQLLPDALRRQRLTQTELDQVLRQQSQPALDQIAALVLETDGSFAVVPTSTPPPAPSSPGAAATSGAPHEPLTAATCSATPQYRPPSTASAASSW